MKWYETRLSGFPEATKFGLRHAQPRHRHHSMISYAPTEGGIGPHVDNYDVFLLQVAEN